MNYNLYLTNVTNDLNKSYNHTFVLNKKNKTGTYISDNEIVYGDYWVNCLIICDKCGQNIIIHTPIYEKLDEVKDYKKFYITYDSHFYIIHKDTEYVLTILTCEEIIIKNIIE